jgi:hypothetical protein
MFGLSTASLILYGGLMAAGAGGVYYVMDLRSDRAECRASLATQNDAIEDLRDEGTKTTGELRKALEATKPAASAAAARVAARKAIPAPADCNAAFDILDRP